MKEVYAEWRRNYKELESFSGGDQVWTGKYVANKALYIDEHFPNLKKNLKFHLGQKVFGQWQFPNKIPNNVKTVDCGGRPKPHEIKHLSYIVKNWHEV